MKKKKGFVAVLLLAGVFLPAKAQFGGARWIGAVTKADAHLPEGRVFSGAMLKDSAVKAAWAAASPLSRRSIVLEKRLKVEGGRLKVEGGKLKVERETGRLGVRRATVNICGLGFYELSINGRKVGSAVLAPHWSDYDKTVFYNTYDVTDLFRGRSACPDMKISVLLGNGFYNEQGGRYHKMKISFGPPTLLFRLHLTYENGETADVLSDDTWTWRESPVTFNSIYGGEDYDARLEKVEGGRWKVEGGRWKVEGGRPVVIQEGPKGVLCRQIAEPIKIMEYYDVCRRLPSGVFDMGQNLSGFPEISVSGAAGQRVRLTVGETLDGGHVSQKQTGRPHYYVYTLKGEGKETWHPRFSYYGFRYIEVEGAVMEGEDNPEGLPVVHRLRSCFIYNSARKTGSFECSNGLLNDAYRLIDRAVRSNWQAVWTDCPHREKLGWLEQDWLNGEGLAYNYDCRRMIEQTVRQVADAQQPNGAVPTTAPQYTVFPGETWGKPFNESPEWGGVIVALPMLYLRHYQDTSLVSRYFPQMLRYVDYLATQAQPSESGLDKPCLLNQGLGDWYDYVAGEKAGFAKNTPVSYVSTAHYYRWTMEVARAAEVLSARSQESGVRSKESGVRSKEDIARRLQARGDSIRQALNSAFYDAENHRYATGSQCAQAIALELGLAPEGDRQAVLDTLVADIHRHGDRLTTGDVGNRYLFNCLARNGQSELLYRMLNHYETPGYGYQIRQGMTTLTEQWDPAFGSSMNHFMMGHLLNLLIPHFLGIQLKVEGGKLKVEGGAKRQSRAEGEETGRLGDRETVLIRPCPAGDMTWCKGSTELGGGKVSASWKIADNQFLLEVDIPAGATAQVVLPSGRRHCVGAGHHRFSETLDADA